MIALTPTFVIMLAFALVAGAVLHELTHYVMALAAGADAWFEWPPAVVYALPVDTPTWVDRWINISPQAIGAGVAVPVLVVHGIPTGPGGVAAIAGWMMYCWGSIEDVSYAAAHGDDHWLQTWWRGLTPSEQDIAFVIFGFGVAGSAYVVSSAFGYRAQQTVMLLALIPLTVSGYYALRVSVREHTTRTERS